MKANMAYAAACSIVDFRAACSVALASKTTILYNSSSLNLFDNEVVKQGNYFARIKIRAS
ncbi:MAG: hypothetical protein IJR50_07705 [Treponema sp.]|nr:hypothetical protein [Treponema sp.]